MPHAQDAAILLRFSVNTPLSGCPTHFNYGQTKWTSKLPHPRATFLKVWVGLLLVPASVLTSLIDHHLLYGSLVRFHPPAGFAKDR